MASKRPTSGGQDPTTSPLAGLSSEDQEFVVHLVLASGSLKGLASQYGVSYPTIRARLDRLIERLEAILADRPVDPVKDLLARLIAGGRLTASTAKSIHRTHQRTLESDTNSKAARG